MGVYQVIERAYGISGLWIYFSFVLGLLFLYYMSDYLKMVILNLNLKGPPTIPFIGNALMIAQKDVLDKFGSSAYQLYGPLIRMWITIFPMVIVVEPHDLHTILSSKKHNDKVFVYKFLHNFLGKGLITSNGNKWRLHRNLIQPALHTNILHTFLLTFADASKNLLEKINAAPKEMNVTHFINNCVMDILNESILGVRCRQNNNINMDDSPFRQGTITMTLRIIKPWLLFDWIYSLTESSSTEIQQKNRLSVYTRKMIEIRRNAKNVDNELTDENRKYLIDDLIDISNNTPGFTDDDIIDEACTFMLAGQDSVGAAISFTLFSLAQHSEYQEKCTLELDEIFQGDDRIPNINDINDMKYLEQCIKETLRLYPSVPLIARRLGENIKIGKHTLISGANVLITPYITHRLPHIYPDPERYDPERFSPEECAKRHPCAYLPFSAGPRNCIGNRFALVEMKTVISTILRNYKLMPVEGKTKANILFRVTIRAHGGLWIRFEPRN